MVAQRPDEIRRKLSERVARRVQGHGIPRATVDAAVDKVLSALDAKDSGAVSTAPPSAPQSSIVVALTGRSVPDLASRVRAALEREGVTVDTIGSAMAGSHNVVTLRVSSASRAIVDRVASALKLSVSLVPESEAS
jgi:hypothetical protein